MTDIKVSRLFSASSIDFFGVGRTTCALLELLKKQGTGAEITLRSDTKIRRDLLPDGLPLRILEGASAFNRPYGELLISSPSVRRERAEFNPFRDNGCHISSDCEIFFEICREPTFVVTGSDGKSTTATLSQLLFSLAGESVALIGNVGVPMLPTLGSAEKYVCELSSFNLHYLNAKFKRAAVTNITPNHLNFHETFEEYADSKLSALRSAEEPIVYIDNSLLLSYANSSPVYAVCKTNGEARELAKEYRAEVTYTLSRGYIERCGERLLPLSAFPSPTEHLIKNFMLAAALTDGYVGKAELLRAAREFSGLPHRQECFLTKDGRRFVDSSIDTTPTRCITTLCAEEGPLVLMLGGRGKGVSYAPLKNAVAGRVRVAILFGEDRRLIEEEIRDFVPCISLEGFEEAVSCALSLLRDNETLLLSPAATSYDEFSSFEERGNSFQRIIKEYYS